MQRIPILLVVALLAIAGRPLFAQSPTPDSIKVLCLYGSIPAKGWEGREPIYGGGPFNKTFKLHGGHAAIQVGDDSALSFQPDNYPPPFHAGHIRSRCRPEKFNCCFSVFAVYDAWSVLGNYYHNIDSLKRAVFVIPVTPDQKRRIDSLTQADWMHAPYDYAFLGMRCASASYQVLQYVGLMPAFKKQALWHKVFTTRKLRSLLYKAYWHNRDKGWRLYLCKGSVSRKWESDKLELIP